jgi:hypothetical protein
MNPAFQGSNLEAETDSIEVDGLGTVAVLKALPEGHQLFSIKVMLLLQKYYQLIFKEQCDDHIDLTHPQSCNVLHTYKSLVFNLNYEEVCPHDT